MHEWIDWYQATLYNTHEKINVLQGEMLFHSFIILSKDGGVK
jgi:hypothetical protein